MSQILWFCEDRRTSTTDGFSVRAKPDLSASFAVFRHAGLSGAKSAGALKAADQGFRAQDSFQKSRKKRNPEFKSGTRFGQSDSQPVKTSVFTACLRLIGACLLCCEVFVRSCRECLEVPDEVPVVVAEPVPPVRVRTTGTDPEVPQARADLPGSRRLEPRPDLDLRARRRNLIRIGPTAS